MSDRPSVAALKQLTPVNSWVKDVCTFQIEKMGFTLPEHVTVPDAAGRAALIGLIYEESRELQKALVNGDVENVVDAVGDLIYSAIGVALHHGVDISPVFEEIHLANMEKGVAAGGFGRMTADGKSTKEGWTAPRIAELLQIIS